MQVILLEDVSRLGRLGDVVKVKPGYARNFLIPRGKAKRATAQSIAFFEAKRADFERQQKERVKEFKGVVDHLTGAVVEMYQLASAEGRLFGSVSAQNIVDYVNKTYELSLPKTAVLMTHGALKTVGEHSVRVSLPYQEDFEIKVVVHPEKTSN